MATMARRWSGAWARPGMVLVLVLLGMFILAGCDGGEPSVSQPKATAKAATTTAALAWQPVVLPNGMSLSNTVSLAVSPYTDGRAWVCARQGTGTYAFYQTTDAGATWHQTGTLALPATPYPVGGCQLLADSGSDHNLVAVFMYGAGAAGTLSAIDFFTSGDGATWRQLPGQGMVRAFATAGSTTFAVIAPGEQQTDPTQPRLAASGDGFRTMSLANLPASAAATSVFQLWSAPGTTSLLVGGDGAAWESEDGGAHWTSIALPPRQATGFQVHFAVRGRPLAPWMICGGGEPTASSSGQVDLSPVCSTDLGKTWHERPTWTSTMNCTACYKGGSQYSSPQPCGVSMLAPDGSLLAFCAPPGTSSGTSTLGGAWHVFRLAPTAKTWQDLGAPPSVTGNIIAATRTQVWFLGNDGDNATGLWVATLPTA